MAKPITGTDSAEVLNGTTGDDVIYGYGGADTLNGGNGNDFLIGDNIFSTANTRVSVSPNGAQSANSSFNPVFSADGTQVAFIGGPLAPFNSGNFNLYVKNLVTGGLTLAASSNNGIVGAPVFSADGTRIAFTANNQLVAADTNSDSDVYVKDLLTGTLTLASSNSQGQAGQNIGHPLVGAAALSPQFSPDGTKVVFESDADNLVAGDTNAARDIFIKDLTSGVTTRVSTGTGGFEGTGGGGSHHAVFSPDGNKVAFDSTFDNLYPGNGNSNRPDIFLKDLVTGTTTLVSQSVNSGGPGNGFSFRPAFSPSGNQIVFSSNSGDLGPALNTNFQQIFVKDLVTQNVSVWSTDGSQNLNIGNANSDDATFSPDGNFLLFWSVASNLAAGDGNGQADVFLKNLATQQVTLLSANGATLGNGESGGSNTGHPMFSGDGGSVVYASNANNLLGAGVDSNGQTDIFVTSLHTAVAGDILNGGAGNDRMMGGGGDDTLDGGSGVDVAYYTGARSSYTITRNADGSITVTDNRGGSPDGSDHLSNVERLQFNDMTLQTVQSHDFNGDNSSDILIQNAGSGQIAYGNMAGGVFQGWANVSTTPGFTVVGEGRIAGDGSSDVVIQNASGVIDYANLVSGAFSSWLPVANTPGWTAIGVGDVNGDGFADVVIQSQSSGQIAYANMFNGAFAGLPNVGTTPGWIARAVADVNDDGFADVVIQNTTSGQIAYGNMLNGALQSWVNVGTTPGWNVTGAGDVNSDGFADVVIQDQSSGQIAYGNMLNGTFQSWVNVATTPGFNVTAVEDVNRDGYDDVVVESTGGSGQLLYANMAGGTFQNWVGVSSAPGWTGHTELDGGSVPTAVRMLDPGPQADEAPAPVRMFDPGPQVDGVLAPVSMFDPGPSSDSAPAPVRMFDPGPQPGPDAASMVSSSVFAHG